MPGSAELTMFWFPWGFGAAAETASSPVGMIVATGALAVIIALLIDRIVGEPPAWAHPVVAMGKALETVGRRIGAQYETGTDLRRFAAGAIAWCGLGALAVFAYAVPHAVVSSWAANGNWWTAALVMGVLLKPLLAWRMLANEVQAVEAALQQSLAAGRQRLSWLVSRNTADLDKGQIRESAIETLAENLNDSVVAPLFWFALFGLPGAALYRFANTADAMWGYPGWRGNGAQARWWRWAGKWAARADDVMSWLPARLTALMLLTACAADGRIAAPGRLKSEARATPSPNGGWPMGAMALALGIRLGKPGVYALNAPGRVPDAADVRAALRLARTSVMLLAGLALAVLIAAMVAHV